MGVLVSFGLAGELLAEFLAGVGGEDFFEPADFGGLVFAGEDFNNVALVEFSVEVGDFAVDFDAGNFGANFGVEAKSEIERKGAFEEVNHVAFGGVDEDLVGEKVEFKFAGIDLFAMGELGAGFLELFDPEEVGGELLDFAADVIFAKFLLGVMERCGETAFGIIMHFTGANLKFDDVFFRGDDGGVDGLVTILFRGGDVVFDAALHGGKKSVDDAKGEIAIGDVADDNAQGNEIVDAIDVLIVFGEFAMERIDGFNATVDFKLDFFFAEGGFNGRFGGFELFVGGFEFGLRELVEFFVAFGIDMSEADFFELGADATHLQSVG